MALQWRRTRDGDWAVMGPRDELKVGEVTVERKDGTTSKVNVKRISRPFDADGVECAYGFLQDRRAKEDEPEDQPQPETAGGTDGNEIPF